VCVLEYLLQFCFSEEVKITAYEYVDFFVRKANDFFPEISVKKFDFFKDSIFNIEGEIIQEEVFDSAIFFGSAYVMNDDNFIRVFQDLKNNGVLRIVDFQAAFMNFKNFMKFIIEPITRNNTIRKLFHKHPLTDIDHSNFQGYSRNRRSLRKLYKKSGWRIVKELSFSSYNYVAILETE
jgi:hypothetical protein